MYDCIISLKEWQVYCKSHLHGPAFVYEEYIDCILVFIIRVCDFQKTNSDHFRKRKSCHATSVAIFWDSCSKILRPNLAEKMNGEHFDKINIKTVITYIHPYAKLQSIWRIPDYGRKFAQNKEWWKFEENGTEFIFGIKNQTPLLSFT